MAVLIAFSAACGALATGCLIASDVAAQPGSLRRTVLSGAGMVLLIAATALAALSTLALL